MKPAALALLIAAACLCAVRFSAAQTAPTPVPTAGALVVPVTAPTLTPAPSATPFTAASCADAITGLYLAATEACIGRPAGTLCNGGAPLQAEPAGPLSASLGSPGALVEAALVDAFASAPFTPENGVAGIAYLRPPDPMLYTAFVLGDVRLRDVSPPEFPAWTAMTLDTSPQHPACPSAPAPLVVFQTPVGYGVRIVINAISLYLNGTAVVRTDAGATRFVLLGGAASALAGGQETPFNVGEQVDVAHAPDDITTPVGLPSSPRPYDPALVADVPIALFERPILAPQPGYVMTQGAVNMRTAPSTDAAVVLQVPAGEILSVLGSNPEQSWLHVRRDSGETGWMYAELLARNLGTITAIYNQTPLPPQRLGVLGTQARVIAAGVALRTGPDQIFPAIAALQEGAPVTLIARSPYSPWMKIDAGGVTGWVAILALQTQAYLDALPLDYQAPGLPTPTVPPGSFGNAFPDPNLPGN